MIEWQEHSTASERTRLADELDVAQASVYAAQREELAAITKLSRQRKPENVVKASKALEDIRCKVKAAQKVHDKAVRTMCEVHVDLSLDDLVELVDTTGSRKREPILVEVIEFNRNADGSFWLRIQGVLLAESTTGRPQLRQGFDLQENDARTKLIRHN